jgi:hypothetical protein
MKTIQLQRKRNGDKFETTWSKAEEMLRLGSNLMSPVEVPEDSKYFYDTELGVLKRKPRNGKKQENSKRKPLEARVEPTDTGSSTDAEQD